MTDDQEKLEKFGMYDPRFEHDACGVGFVCDIKGRQSHQIVEQALEVLKRLAHRGATGADPLTGDGAGILIQMPDEFLRKVCERSGINLPERGNYGSGLVFLPTDPKERQACKDIFSRIIKEEGQLLLGWREVKVLDSQIGETARNTKPGIEQPFIGSPGNIKDVFAFERKLYVIRKKIENAVRKLQLKQSSFFYITNLSSSTLTYKGLLMPGQVGDFFVDLRDPEVKSAICLVHSRYSTNTFPTWDRAQPFRFLAHNGEINTLRGNINWMRARERLLKNKFFGKSLKEILPIIVPGGSDSASIDNVFELLVLSGRPLAQVMMMLIPSAWEQNKLMDDKLKDFYRYHACLMEPWDGPAAIAFTDGKDVGAVLDRNGLRPARYIITKNDLVIMASEVGVLDIPPEDILVSGRLEPGKIFYIDTQAGAVIDDAAIKDSFSKARPYGRWLQDKMLKLSEIKDVRVKKENKRNTNILLKAFGFTREDLKMIIRPMAETGQEPVGSMGNDTAHAVLSLRPQLLYSYFKQLFAQVTNPAIDPIREELVMSLSSFLGPEKNLLEETAEHCHKLWVKNPILTSQDLEKIRQEKVNGFKTKTISLLFEVKKKDSFQKALRYICLEAEKAVKQGFTFIVLSDRGVDKEHAATPALLACATLHHYLVKNALRKETAIILETGEPREVHHFALLFGYGADCVNPYLAYQAVEYMIQDERLSLKPDKGIYNYTKAVSKGLMKILSKMGISTLQSYRGAQIFEALGLSQEVIDRCFPGTVSRVGGVDLKIISQEAINRHQEAFGERAGGKNVFASGGLYQWKKDGEFHLWNPESITYLQDAARAGNYQKYKEFAGLINDQSKNPATLRSLFSFKYNKPIPLEEVEPAKDIVRRFATGAMSFGSISRATHETIALAMNKLGGRSNTGEGGEDPMRFVPLPNGDSLRSAIKQVASGRFGVNTNYLVNADEIQIKIAQGAKPGEGGQLPGHKVSAVIAKTRYTTPGVTLISPPPHHDIYSIEDLAQLIFDLKNVNPKARISVKLVSEIGIGTVAAGVAKGHADMILIAGGDGGTGASPLSSIKHAGLPWELGLSETHQTLVLNDLRSRVRLQADGQMRTGRDVAIAAILGAEEFGFATAVLIVLGCVMLRHCSLNNCSVGIATQDDILEKKFTGRPEYLINYFNFIAEELREIMSGLGVRNMNEMIGHTEFLEVNKDILPWKAQGIDLSRILYKPEVKKGTGIYSMKPQDHNLGQVLDKKLIDISALALSQGQKVKAELDISNINRTCGAMLSGEVCRAYGEEGLPADTINLKFKGYAGQSFGAFLANGITFELEGMANDYVGKGISGGKIIIYPDKRSVYDPARNVIIGNTAFYGAITGHAYIRGKAGERFCIRNSGLHAVVEGVGDHGCEYMTGGRVIILGETGRNFAAGMSGGIAYIYDPRENFKNKCNLDMVLLEKVTDEDLPALISHLKNHFKYTKSPLAKEILSDGAGRMNSFVKVMPIEYKRVIEENRARISRRVELYEVLDG